MGSSLLRRAFSSMLVRGIYTNEKPAVDFNLVGSKQEKRRLTAMVNHVCKYSPLGKSVLEAAAKEGFTLGFEMQLLSAGICSPEDKTLVLNPMMSDDSLYSTLIHESRHAQQHGAGTPKEMGSLTVKSEIMLYRAMEADAQATAVLALLEMRGNTNESAPFEKFQDNNAKIVAQLPEKLRKYQVNYEKYTPTAEDMQSAFKGWYKNDYMVERYEEGYLRNPMEYVMEEKDPKQQKEDLDLLAYKKSVSSESIVKMFCKTADGKCYWEKNPKVLEEPLMLAVSPQTKETADKFFEFRKQKNGKEPDTSYQYLPERKDRLLIVDGQIAGGLGDFSAPSNKTAALAKILQSKRSR